MERVATREEVLEKIGEGGAPKADLSITPRNQAGAMREDKAPAGSVRVVAGRAGATAGAVSLTD
jgi:hypothetical protein